MELLDFLVIHRLFLRDSGGIIIATSSYHCLPSMRDETHTRRLCRRSIPNMSIGCCWKLRALGSAIVVAESPNRGGKSGRTLRCEAASNADEILKQELRALVQTGDAKVGLAESETHQGDAIPNYFIGALWRPHVTCSNMSIPGDPLSSVHFQVSPVNIMAS